MKTFLCFLALAVLLSSHARAQFGTGDGIPDEIVEANGVTYGLDAQIPPVVFSDPQTVFDFDSPEGDRHIEVTAGWFQSPAPGNQEYPAASITLTFGWGWMEVSRFLEGDFYTHVLFPEPPWQPGDFTSIGNWASGSANGHVLWQRYNFYFNGVETAHDAIGLTSYNCTLAQTYEVVTAF